MALVPSLLSRMSLPISELFRTSPDLTAFFAICFGPTLFFGSFTAA